MVGQLPISCTLVAGGVTAVIAAILQLDQLDKEAIIWLFQVIFGVTTSVFAFLVLRIFRAVDRLNDGHQNHEGRISHIEGRMEAHKE